ncbi:DUF4091 domain-containing protein [Vitiosangium sp. GDMCC 1.1324]|uniref:DUF4091 domain-containing protein n=1 Tax=Vitiosangium sp. (strain GDMCC 1.1324) TaxID=2138576 RepID=UPI000D362689|nr:DUF4091 domain-containing protein [Vitiosangium sp. GDMCC 1.1324]PTL81571.1 hypothetical protein DAT35_21670 [Vitiosangium sp. GDMCC 1.1324]
MRAFACVLGVWVLALGLPARAGPDPSVWGVSAMEKVQPQTAPGSSSSVRLFAARNEFVSFQVGLHGGDSGWSGVSASLPALEGPMRIEGADIVLYRETLLHVTHPTMPYSKVGWWPDGLVPDVDETVGEKRQAFPMDVPANESRALWVDVHVPMDAPPGEYYGTVEVVGANGYRLQVDVALTVVDWVMPSTSSLRTSFLVWTPSVCQAFTGQRECSREDQLRLLSYFQKLGLEHRITFVSRFDPQDIPDWPTFEQWWGPFLSGTAPLRLPGAKMTCVEYAGPPTPEQLKEFEAETGARGLQSLSFFPVGDEPPWNSTYDEVLAHARLSRQVAPNLRTMLTIWSIDELDRRGLTDLIDIGVVIVDYLYKSPGKPEAEGRGLSRYEAFLRRPNRELWIYQSCGTHGCGGVRSENVPGQGWPSYMVDVSPAKARALEWISFQVGATGEHYYQVAEMLSSAWTDQYKYGGNGDGTLVYPGTVSVIGGTTSVPLPSLRLKLIRQGMQDYEWLKQVRDSGDPAFAQAVARDLVRAPWLVPDDGDSFERARVLLIQRYLMLIGAEIPESVDAYLSEHPGRPPRDEIAPVRLGE